MKKFIVTLLVILIIGYVVYLFQKPDNVIPDIQWTYNASFIDDDVDPSTKVTLDIAGKSYDLGTYTGSCFEREDLEKNMHEISGIRCWWAGAGDDLGVFQER